MAHRVEEGGVPLFISVVRNRTHLPNLARMTFKREFNDAVARKMMKFLRQVATALLLLPIIDDEELRNLRAFVSMIQTDKECEGNEEGRGEQQQQQQQLDDQSDDASAEYSQTLSALTIIPDYLVTELNKDDYFASITRSICSRIESSLKMDFLFLDSDKISRQTMESMIRLFPSLLGPMFHKAMEHSARKKSISFVPLLVKLGMEFGNVRERGGLLTKNYSGVTRLQDIASALTFDIVDVLNELREENLLVEEDIWNQDLLHYCLEKGGKKNKAHFASNINRFDVERFQYLAKMNPLSLTKTSKEGMELLHHSVQHWDDPLAFQTVFELGIEHYPATVGFLFQCNETLGTPFAMACNKYGAKVVSKIIMEGLSKSHLFDTKTVLESLVFLVSSVDEKSDGVEGAYFLLRRDPSLLEGSTSIQDNKKKTATARSPEW